MAEENVEADSVTEGLAEVFSRHADPHFERVVRASTVLVDGVAARGADLDRVLHEATAIEVLPPFAGG